MDENSILIIDESTLKDKLYLIRGKEVMLDVDLEKIFCNSCGSNECSRSQNVTLTKRQENKRDSNVKYNNYAITEQGVYMLIKMLNQSIKKVDKRVGILENKLNSQEEWNNNISNYLSQYEIPEQKLFMNNKLFDADIVLKDIFETAKQQIYIIDDYINLKTLSLLRDIDSNVKVTIFSDNKWHCLHLYELNDFYKEYSNIKIDFIHTSGKVHDRFIIIDYGEESQKWYLCGCSLKDCGGRITAITEVYSNDCFKFIIDTLLKNKELVIK